MAARIQPIPFSEDIIRCIAGAVLPQNIIPDWPERLGYPEQNQDAVRIFNEHAGPYIGLRIEEDGSASGQWTGRKRGPRNPQQGTVRTHLSAERPQAGSTSSAATTTPATSSTTSLNVVSYDYKAAPLRAETT